MTSQFTRQQLAEALQNARKASDALLLANGANDLTNTAKAHMEAARMGVNEAIRQLLQVKPSSK